MSGPRDKLAVDLQRRRITIIDEGQPVGEFAIAQMRRAGTAYGRSWAVVFQDAALSIAAADISPAAHRIAWWALATLHPREWSRVNASDVALAFGWHRTTASRALAEIEAAGIIERSGRDHRALRLSLAMGWQGTVQAYQKERRHRSTRLALADPPQIMPGWRQADHAETVGEKGAGATQRATGQRERPRQGRGRVKP